MKHKVGDVVTIRKDLTDTDVYYMDDGTYSDNCTDEMIDQGGKKLTITQVFDRGYWLNNSGWNWTDEMFEEEE